MSIEYGPAVIEQIEPGAVLGGAGKRESEREEKLHAGSGLRPVHRREAPRCAMGGSATRESATRGSRAGEDPRSA